MTYTPAVDRPHARAPQSSREAPDPDIDDDESDAVHTVIVTFFTDHAATTKREQRLSLEALAQLIHTTTASDKALLPWLKLAIFGDRRSRHGALRNNDNVVAITGLEGDYDAGKVSLAEAKDIIARADITAILYPSPSYTPAEPKWRVLAPFSQEYTPTERDRFMARLNGLFSGVFSRESWVWSQSYYYGRVVNPDHHATVFEGTPIDLADWLDAGAIGKPAERNAGRPAHPASSPEHITEARVRGLVRTLLDNIRSAEDGEKHFTLRNIGLTLGGYLHVVGWSIDEAVEQAIGALPSADDWDAARTTARWGIERGMQRPLDLEDRPNPHRANGPPPPDPPPDGAPEPPPPEPDDPEPAWQRRLLRNDKGNAMPILANALVALREAPVWQGAFAWNEFSSRVTVMRHLPGHNGLEIPRELTEADISRATDWLQHHGVRVSSGTTLEAIRTVADHHRFHPVREYLGGLRWDGVPRIDRWLIDHLGAEDTNLNQAFGAKWLIGCVARVMQPGCKVDCALILEARQGLMKSTTLSTLGSPWFTDHMPELGSKDAMEQLQGVWIIELAELSSLGRAEASRVKAFLSTRSDRFRPSYGRTAADHPRQCAFAGSINPAGAGYLRDETGNRRFWCVRCALGWPDDRRVDIATLAAQRDQLWAEAVHRYQQGEPWWLDVTAEAQAEGEAEERYESDSREDLIRNYLRGRSYTRMTELFSEPCLNIPTDRQTRATQMEIGRIMTAMKWTRRRRRNRHQEREYVYLAPGKHLDDVRDW